MKEWKIKSRKGSSDSLLRELTGYSIYSAQATIGAQTGDSRTTRGYGLSAPEAAHQHVVRK